MKNPNENKQKETVETSLNVQGFSTAKEFYLALLSQWLGPQKTDERLVKDQKALCR